MQVHYYHQHFGRIFSINEPDAHSVILDYVHCHLIDDYAVCDAHLILIDRDWIDALNDDVLAQAAAFDVDDDDDSGDGAADDDDDDDAMFVVVFLH